MGKSGSKCSNEDYSSSSDDGGSEDERSETSEASDASSLEGGDNPGGKAALCTRFDIWRSRVFGFDFQNASELKARPSAGPTMKAMIADNSGKNVDAYFHIDRKSVLGTGGFATVCLATTKTTGRKLAVKCILKAKIPDKARLADEIKTMLALDHPNIIKLFQTFEDSKQIYLVMELCAGGELFDVIVAQDKVSESDAAIIMQQMFRAVNYMHEAGVCHRDIKPENFLFTQKGVPIKSNTLKIVDFGIAAVFEARKASFTSRLGTPFYVAPEVLARGARYNEKADLWSCGVILYVLLSGQLPFKGHDDPATLAKVALGKYCLPTKYFGSVSTDAKVLIRNLLEKNPRQRFSAKQALDDTWISSTALMANSAPLSMAVVDNLRKFSYEHRLKKAALHVVARYNDSAAIEQLRDKFLELDSNGDGLLTAAELREGLKKAGISQLPQEIQELFDRVDVDGSGQIDYTEFLAATLERQTVVQESECWAAFRVFDKNDDGIISREELREVLSSQEVNSVVTKEQIDRILDEVDLNGDGEIDFDEFMAMMRK